MGYGMKLTDSLLREKVRKIGPLRRENKTMLCRRYGRSLNDEASDVLVPALSTYGVSGRDIPKQVANYSKQQRQQQVSDWFSSEFLFLLANRHEVCLRVDVEPVSFWSASGTRILSLVCPSSLALAKRNDFS